MAINFGKSEPISRAKQVVNLLFEPIYVLRDTLYSRREDDFIYTLVDEKHFILGGSDTLLATGNGGERSVQSHVAVDCVVWRRGLETCGVGQ